METLGLFFFGSCLPARPKRLAQAGLYNLALMRNRQGLFIALFFQRTPVASYRIQVAGMECGIQCPMPNFELGSFI
jgi:hypothetical protein